MIYCGGNRIFIYLLLCVRANGKTMDETSRAPIGELNPSDVILSSLLLLLYRRRIDRPSWSWEGPFVGISRKTPNHADTPIHR